MVMIIMFIDMFIDFVSLPFTLLLTTPSSSSPPIGGSGGSGSGSGDANGSSGGSNSNDDGRGVAMPNLGGSGDHEQNDNIVEVRCDWMEKNKVDCDWMESSIVCVNDHMDVYMDMYMIICEYLIWMCI